ncbi:hypothetical protein WOLCODRAFT_18355 [Wolfiporia cocos MD-104 SS10]|uniref:Uncharacterized protein n=1 Tax=Wolfiporia cocos (strain MD-104) TaxID=742152 RepID=A0A2H3JMP3_WOLCO|nr:hypothetical protein WOLCODRAFT_18355 [Wolfiporia cocos MD-104 SS10]
MKLRLQDRQGRAAPGDAWISANELEISPLFYESDEDRNNGTNISIASTSSRQLCNERKRGQQSLLERSNTEYAPEATGVRIQYIRLRLAWHGCIRCLQGTSCRTFGDASVLMICDASPDTPGILSCIVNVTVFLEL